MQSGAYQNPLVVLMHLDKQPPSICNKLHEKYARLYLNDPKCNHSIFRHDNFIGCFSADKIKMSVRKYFCFNIPIDKNMAEGLFCRSPYHEEYIQTSASGNPEDLYRSTYSFLSGRR